MFAFSDETLNDKSYFEFISQQKTENFSNNLKFFDFELEEVANYSFKTDFSRLTLQNFNAKQFEQIIDFDSNIFENHLALFGTTPTHLFAAIFALNYFEQNSEEKFVTFGIPFANRSTIYGKTVGYFVNTHAIAISRPNSDISVADFMEIVKDKIVKTLEYSSVPFDSIVKRLKPKREINKSPIFQVMVIFEDLRSIKTIDDVIEIKELAPKIAKFEQTWRIQRFENNKIRLKIEYCENLFKFETIKNYVENFEKLFKRILTTVGTENAIGKLSTFLNIKSKICQIWKKLLDVDEINDETNFFDVGGHSLLAARIISSIKKELNFDCSVKILFENQCFGEFVLEILRHNNLAIENDENNDTTNIDEHFGTFPASKLQMPLLELLRKAKVSKNYSLMDAYVNKIQIICPKNVENEKIRNLICRLIQRHPALRTTFFYNQASDANISYFQKISPASLVDFQIKNSFENCLDIFETEPIRAKIENIDSEKVLTLEVNHLVTDGHSMNIIAQDLFSFFNDESLEPIKTDYIQFSKLLNDESKHEEKIAFWKNYLNVSLKKIFYKKSQKKNQ